METGWIQRGKWAESGVPHSGWECISIEDLGKNDQYWIICEMCESQSIRYVHSMIHPDYDVLLACGCICAGNMEGSVDIAKSRERRFKQAEARKAKRLQQWSNPETWRRSEKGNYWRKEKGTLITVFRQGGQWRTLITNESTGLRRFSARSYNTGLEAARAASDEYSDLTR